MRLLDINISDTLLVYLFLGIIVIIIIAWNIYNKIIQSKHEAHLKQQEAEGKLQQAISDIEVAAQKLGLSYLEEWKENELEELRKVLAHAADSTAKAALSNWIIEHEEKIRKDAAHRSLKVNLGKVTEHLLPFSHLFNNFNPKDARFIGSPIDLIVFDGVCDKKDLVEIYFIEIKTGGSSLSQTQKKIRSAIENHRVHWIPISLKDEALNLELDV